MLGTRSFTIAVTCVFVGALAALQPTEATAQTISLSLNVFYNTPSDVGSGGVWQLSAKSSNFGIAGLRALVTNIGSPLDLAPIATVNGSELAGFSADALIFNPPSGTTPAYFELDFGQATLDPLSPGQEQGAFYGVGQLANGSPNFPGKPAGSNFEGPAFTTLTDPFGVPWATGDVFGDPAWNTGVELAVGNFPTGVTPAFLTGNIGNVFSALGTSTTFGSVTAATVSTIVRTNFAALLGDYNHNGVVDAADYVIWRSTLNQSVTAGTGADGNSNGIVDQADFDVWRAHFGSTSGSGSGGSLSTGAVPEPFSGLLFAIGAMLTWSAERSFGRKRIPAFRTSGDWLILRSLRSKMCLSPSRDHSVTRSFKK
ncbi:MAG TPA: hypothetical protein VHU84_04080 [Lacipirellulaceae bacterium]|nr:hypothetical protein [Lacipirellulaceae bacterium]